MTSLLLDEDARPLDIVTVYTLESAVLLETSFGMGTRTQAYLESQLQGEADLRRLNGDQAVLGIEGPYAWGVVGRVIDADLTALPYESVVETEWDEQPILFARSGFTSEYGYKVLTDVGTAARLWDAVAAEAQPVGYEVLETAMLEVRQPVLHREVGDDGTVLSCGYNWLIDLTKEDFVGRAALDAEVGRGPAALTVGFQGSLDAIPDAGATVTAAGVEVGRVVHAVFSPANDAHVGLARVSPDVAAAGLELSIETPTGSAGVRTVSSPYVTPTSWSVPVF
jgi:aminomethyltransferase